MHFDIGQRHVLILFKISALTCAVPCPGFVVRFAVRFRAVRVFWIYFDIRTGILYSGVCRLAHLSVLFGSFLALPQRHLLSQSLLFVVCSRLRMQPHRTSSNNSLLQWAVTVHLSSCSVCLGGSGISVLHFGAAFSSVLVGIFWVVVSRFFSTWDSKGAKDCKSCRSRKMLKNDSLIAKIGFDTEITCSLKFDDLADKSEKGSISNFSTKRG